MHPNDLEWSDYSIAMRNKNYRECIDKLRNSSTEFKGTAGEQIKLIVDTFISVHSSIHLSINSDNKFLEYPLLLASEAIKRVIENNKVTVGDIEKAFIGISNCTPILFKYLAELKSTCLNVLDLKRLEMNHDIINSRFLLANIAIQERHRTYSACRLGFPVSCYLDICEKLDTYNLELPEKINLMVEEIAYLMNNVANPELNDISDTNWFNNNQLIIPTVLTYIFGEYSNDSVPNEAKLKVLEAAYNKLSHSYYITHNNIIPSECLDTMKCIADGKHPNNLFYEKILDYQVSGRMSNKQEFINLITEHLILNWESDFYLLFMILYYYGVFTNKIESMNISISKLLMHGFNNFIRSKSQGVSKFVPSTFITKFNNFSKCIVTTDIDVYSERKTRALNMIHSISDVVSHISNVAYVNSITQNYTKPKFDKEDFTGYLVPGETSDYDKKILSGFKVLNDLENKLESLDTNAFIDLTLNKDIALQGGPKYVNSMMNLISENLNLFDINHLKSTLETTKKEISEVLSVNPTNENYNVSNSISSFILFINNTQTLKESEDIKDITNKVNDIQLEDYDIDNSLSSTLNEISKNTSSVANLVYTINDVLSVDMVQEMKLSSYATMVMDKVKKGIQYLDDKQKQAFVTIDRIADSVEHWDDKEERADARIQIVKGRMLPSLSKCIKAILVAGGLSFVSIYLGILYLVIKYVTSKNAVATERQAVCDELEVEVQMIDRRIQEAVDDKDFKKERKLRLLKKKILTHFAKISYDNATKWNNSIVMKPETDNQGSKFGIKEE